LFVQVNQVGLKTIRNKEQGHGSHKGEQKKWDKELPLETDIVQSA
jgi:hypothetical protein